MAARIVLLGDARRRSARRPCGPRAARRPGRRLRPPPRVRRRSSGPRARSSASERIRRWISPLAPTSMPRVGSSRIRMSGFIASQRASSTFCWLPPESSRIFWSGPEHLMPSSLMKRSTISRCLRLVDDAVAADARQQRQRHVLGDAEVGNDALELAVLGDEAETGGDGVARMRRRIGLAVQATCRRRAAGRRRRQRARFRSVRRRAGRQSSRSRPRRSSKLTSRTA